MRRGRTNISRVGRTLESVGTLFTKNGVTCESLVGICVTRSAEMIVGLLGIMKAGGAYVPIDPAYPESRLQYILEDAQIKVLVTQEKLQQKWLYLHSSTSFVLIVIEQK